MGRAQVVDVDEIATMTVGVFEFIRFFWLGVGALNESKALGVTWRTDHVNSYSTNCVCLGSCIHAAK